MEQLDLSSYKEITNTHLESWKHKIESHTQASPAPQASVLTPSTVTLDLESGNNTVVPSQLKKANPQFHLLIYAPKITSNVCRALLSSYILNYPPPTLIGYKTTAENAIPFMSDYLDLQNRIKEDDFVLFADGERTLFQLPSEVLLDEYHIMTRKANRNLASQYWKLPAHKPALDELRSQYYPPPPQKSRQRFNQTVFFAVEPSPPNPSLSVPYLSRFKLPNPRPAGPSLNTGVVLGTGSSLRNLFSAAASQNTLIARSDTTTFRTILAQQTAIRASISHAHRHILHWLSHTIGLTTPSIRLAQTSETVTSAHDLGIGLDETSSLFRTVTPQSAANSAARFGTVAAAPYLSLPASLKTARQPFSYHASTHHANSSLSDPASAPESLLPTTQSWAQVPLLHVDGKHIPAVLTFPLSAASSNASEAQIRDSAVETLWPSLWFAPHARQLLQSYLRGASSKEVASQAAVGGERWWDSRGGRGGVWTTGGEWIDAGELCGEFGAEIFSDGLRGWESGYYDVVDAVAKAEGEKVEVVEVVQQAQQDDGGKKKEVIDQVAKSIQDQVRKKLDSLNGEAAAVDTAVRLPPSRKPVPDRPAERA